MYQDNQSAIKILTNKKNMCTGNSRHINLRHFFVKDRDEKGEIKVQYCPTLLMVSDYFTKSLMGARFRELRSVIMGHKSIHDIGKSLLMPIKERVENTNRKMIGQ